MKRFICTRLPTVFSPAPLSQAEAKHAQRVLRLGQGELVEAVDGRGGAVLARIVTCIGENQKKLELQYVNELSSSTQEKNTQVEKEALKTELKLEISILKAPAMSWLIEKATELQVNSLIPVITTRSVVKTQNRDPDVFVRRWESITEQVLKQSGRRDRMKIEKIMSFQELVSNPRKIHKSDSFELRLWCDEHASMDSSPHLADWLRKQRGQNERKPWKSIRVLIGPEGGWSTQERSALSQAQENSSLQTQKVSLSKNTLRSETAAIFGISLVSGFLLEGK